MLLPAPSTAAQLRATAALFFLAAGAGSALGWASPGLMKLLRGDADQIPFRVTQDEFSWIASMLDVGLLAGSVVSGALFDRAGRKLTACLAACMLVVWAVLTYFARGAALLYVSRVFGGAAIGYVFAFMPMYMAEITTTRLRGVLANMVYMGWLLGHLAEYCVGPFVSHWTLAGVGLALPLLSLALAFWMVESPYYLVAKGRTEEARAALARLRGTTVDCASLEQEMADIQKALQERSSAKRASFRDLCSTPGHRRGAVIVLWLAGGRALTGETAIGMYGQYIFNAAGQGAGQGVVSQEVAAMLLVVVQIVMILISARLINRLGRRPLVIGSYLTAGVGLLAASAFFLLKDNLGVDVASVNWLPLAGLVVFEAACGFGTSSLPMLLSGEVLPQASKALIAPLALSAVAVTSFSIAKSFPMTKNTVGLFLPLGVFALWNMSTVIFAAVFIPETKGKTLSQVQDALQGRRRRSLPRLERTTSL